MDVDLLVVQKGSEALVGVLFAGVHEEAGGDCLPDPVVVFARAVHEVFMALHETYQLFPDVLSALHGPVLSLLSLLG